MARPVKILSHDPRLAREAYEAYARLAGRSRKPASYRLWLNKYVDEIAALLGYVIVDARRLAAWKARERGGR
jgi:hypothetical protein